MSISDLATYIKNNKRGLNHAGTHLFDDESIVLQYSRHEMGQYVYITDEHILECAEKATSYQEHVELCRPLAIEDTKRYNEFKNRKPPKGRTRRRFR